MINSFEGKIAYSFYERGWRLYNTEEEIILILDKGNRYCYWSSKEVEESQNEGAFHILGLDPENDSLILQILCELTERE